MRDRDQILCLSLRSPATWSTSSLLTHAWHTKMLQCPHGSAFSSYPTLVAPPLSQSQANTTGISLLLTTREHHHKKGHVQEWRWMKCDFWIMFSAFFLLLFTTTLLGDCTSSNSKYCLWSVCKSGQGSSSARTKQSRFGLSPRLQYRCHTSTGLTALRFWAVVFPEAVESKLEDKSHCHFYAFTNPELEGPKDYAKLN